MNKELKSLIEKYCMGIKEIDPAHMDEIFDKVTETGTDPKEASSYITEMQDGPTREERLAIEEAEREAKAVAERKAKEEAARKAREEAEQEAKASTEREYNVRKSTANPKSKPKVRKRDKDAYNSFEKSLADDVEKMKANFKRYNDGDKISAKDVRKWLTAGLLIVVCPFIACLCAYGVFYNVYAIIRYRENIWENFVSIVVCAVFAIVFIIQSKKEWKKMDDE